MERLTGKIRGSYPSLRPHLGSLGRGRNGLAIPGFRAGFRRQSLFYLFSRILEVEGDTAVINVINSLNFIFKKGMKKFISQSYSTENVPPLWSVSFNFFQIYVKHY